MATLLLPSGPVGSSVTVLAQARDAAGNLAEDAANYPVDCPRRTSCRRRSSLSAPLEVVEGEGITLVAEVDDNVGVVAVEFLSRQILWEPSPSPRSKSPMSPRSVLARSR